MGLMLELALLQVPGAASDLGVHRACLYVAWVEYIGLVSLSVQFVAAL